MSSITVTELARGLSDVINRATYRGEEFLVLRGGKPVARITPVPASARARDLPSIFEKELPALDKDDLAAFATDLEESRKEMNASPRDPWAS